MKLRLTLVTLVLLAGSSALIAQTAKPYDLQQLLKENKFTLFPPKPFPITDNGKQGIALSGVAWFKGVEFSTGTIELDLQGHDFFQNSFIGIAFHGVDSSTYDVIYFRPFNFQAEDPIRKIHAV